MSGPQMQLWYNTCMTASDNPGQNTRYKYRIQSYCHPSFTTRFKAQMQVRSIPHSDIPIPSHPIPAAVTPCCDARTNVLDVSVLEVLVLLHLTLEVQANVLEDGVTAGVSARGAAVLKQVLRCHSSVTAVSRQYHSNVTAASQYATRSVGGWLDGMDG